MRLLLDTHVAIWAVAISHRIKPDVQKLLDESDNTIFVSAVSIWEIAIKRSLGKLTAPDDLPDRITDEGFPWLPVSAKHAWQVGELPLHHRDPFDRLLIAQAQIEGLAVVTGDRAFASYDVPTVW
jgi:PIN domain nuclease of toxin-antitoxin system